MSKQAALRWFGRNGLGWLRDLQYVWTVKSLALASSFGALAALEAGSLRALDLGDSGVMNYDLDDAVLQARHFLAHNRKPLRQFIAHRVAFCFELGLD
jgi:hypothetical protein